MSDPSLDRVWCVRPAASAGDVAWLVAQGGWPPCTAFEAGGYLFLCDPAEDRSAGFMVVMRATAPGGRAMKVARLTLTQNYYQDHHLARGRVPWILAGGFDALAVPLDVDLRLETPAEHAARRCPFCT